MDTNQKAFALMQVKEMHDDRRVFTGWATTPEADRVGDTINMSGVKFVNPLVLLHQHDHRMPIGQVNFKKPTSKGVYFEATIPKIEEPGQLKDRVDTAWLEIKHGLVRAVSIGFRALKYNFKAEGGVDFEEIEVYELSSVSVPANAAATIQTAKALFSRKGMSDPVRLITRAVPMEPRDPSRGIALIPRSSAVRL